MAARNGRLAPRLGENVLEDGDRVPLELHRSWDAHTVARNKEVFDVWDVDKDGCLGIDEMRFLPSV